MKTDRLIVGGVAVLVGLLLGWMVRGVFTYNPNSASITAYDDWRVACPSQDVKDATCELSTDILDKSQPNANGPVARATVTTDKDGKKVLGFTLPYGVALEAGMGLRVGKDPVKIYQYRTCNGVGCIAVTPFDDALASSLKGADDAFVLFAGLDGKPVQMPLSIKGYSKGVSAWRSADARRRSWFWRLWS